MNKHYGQDFYATRDAGTSYSAQRLADIISDTFFPTSAVDLGCGVGTILAAIKKTGCRDIFGVEGPWLDPSTLVIDKNEFQNFDLSKPLNLTRKFDLATSLEVGEHLDEKDAETLVSSLCSLSNCIVFSAAIPRQGGVNHVNEQWQSYWARKFIARGYFAFDVVRPAIWSDKKVATHYRQNCVAYVASASVSQFPKIASSRVADINLLDRVHLDLFLAHMNNRSPLDIPYKEMLRYFPKATLAAASRALSRIK